MILTVHVNVALHLHFTSQKSLCASTLPSERIGCKGVGRGCRADTLGHACTLCTLCTLQTVHFVHNFAQLSKLAHLSITNAHSQPRCNKHPRTAGSRVARPRTQTSAKLIQADCFQCTHLCTSASSATRIQRNISFECATSATSATSVTSAFSATYMFNVQPVQHLYKTQPVQRCNL